MEQERKKTVFYIVTSVRNIVGNIIRYLNG